MNDEVMSYNKNECELEIKNTIKFHAYYGAVAADEG